MIKNFTKKNINKIFISFFVFIIFLVPIFSINASEATSTNYRVTNDNFGAGDQMNSTNFSVTGSVSQNPSGIWSTNSLPLAPGTITSCGKINTPGTYTLGSNITGISGSCFVVLTNNVVIDGAGHTVTALGGNTNYAITATSSVSNGGSGYSTTTIQNITFTNFGGGVKASGNNNSGGAGGDGGIIVISSSTMGNIISSGGSGNNSGNSGLGGSVSIFNSVVGSITTSGSTNGTINISGNDLDLSNNTYTANTINLSYSGNLITTNTTLSVLTHLIINSTDLGSYIGGSFPLIPGIINSCGTLYFAGSYTLNSNLTGDCNILKTGVSLVGANGGLQKILTGNITANNYGVTISNLTVTGSVSTTGATPGALTLNNASNLIGTTSVTGVISGDGSSSIGNTTINAGGSVATSSISFVGDVVNYGTINSGNSVVGRTINAGIINGDFTFNASSTNSGTVNGNVVLNDSSTNIGTITGTAKFNMYTAISGAVNFSSTTIFAGTGYVTGNLFDTTNSQITSWVFNASSTNTGILKGNAVFNDNSSNTISGKVQGNATFNNNSTNLGIVTGNSNVNSPVVRPLTGTTNGQVIYYGYAGLYFNDTVAGHGTIGKWDDINNWWTDAAFTIHSPVIPTSGDDVIIYGNLTSTSITAFVRTAIFQNNSNNGITLIVSSTSTEATLFNASSTNSGTVIGNATFSGVDSNNSGTVTGYITRQYNSGIYTVVTDFTHNSVHWIVQAINGASVDLSGATYSFLINTFQALNNGFFSAWNNLISSGASGVPNLVINSPVSGTNIKWSPNISWGNATLCQYKIDSGNYISVSCSNNGSDIPRPSATSHIIFFKSTNGNNITEKSVSFIYDNTQPVDTDCSTSLDEATRPYYYLTSNVNNCTATVSTALRGDNNGGGSYFSVGNITGSNTNISLVNVSATGTISNFNNINISSSTLSGNITVNGIFTSDTRSTFGNTTISNGGVVNGGTFIGTLTNNGTITNSTTTPVTVLLSTTNNANITGGFVFNATSTNLGNVTGDTVFNKSSTNSGTVNGNVTLNDSAINSGTVNGDLIFGNLLSSFEAVTFSSSTIFVGTNIVSGNIKDHQGNIISKWIFNDNSENSGLTKGKAFFNGNSKNTGTITGDAYFSDSSINSGTVSGNVDVYYAVAVPVSGNISGAVTYHSYPNSPSFKNQAGDSSWNNISNWFTDTTFEIPLGRTPTTNDKNLVLFASTTLPSDINNNIFIAVSSTTINGADHTVNGNITGDGAYGGFDAYSFDLQNIIVTGTTSAIGGNGTPTVDGGKGGIINVATSSTGVIAVNGGDPEHNGGDAGSATVVNSYAVQEGTPLLAVGGDSVGCGYGGSGGNITLIDSSGYILITGLGADALATIAQGGGCQNPLPERHRTSGSVVARGVYVSPAQRAATLKNSQPKPKTGISILRNLFDVIKPITFNPLPYFTPFGVNFVPQNIGRTVVPYPFQNFMVPPVLKFIKLPTTFTPNISKFLFTPISETITSVFQDAYKLLNVFTNLGIKNEQSVASLINKPLVLKIPTDIPPGHFVVKTNNQTLTTYAYATYDEKLGRLAELIKVSPNQSINIYLIPTNEGVIKATFNGQTIIFDQNNTATVKVPATPGSYVLKTDSSPVPLVVVVTAPPAPAVEIKSPSIWDKIFNWFFK